MIFSIVITAKHMLSKTQGIVDNVIDVLRTLIIIVCGLIIVSDQRIIKHFYQ